MNSIRQFRSWTLVSLLAAATLRCGGDNNVEPRTATKIEMAAGNGQSGSVGQALADPLVVLVTDASDDPVEGVVVHWDPQGTGSVSAETSTTNSDGRASIDRVLGSDPGDETTTASANGLEGSPVTFVSTAVEGGSPGSIELTANPPVAALSGEVFDPAVQPAVLVKDGTGNPAAGVEVTASLVSGSGTLDGVATLTTDADGVAQFGDLGITGSGEHTLEFAAGTFTVTSSPIDISPLPSEATTGTWGPVVQWSIVPLHMSLLPTGKILAWGKYEDGGVTGTMGTIPRLWDPSVGAPTTALQVPADTMLFCSGHVLMADGRLMVSGGHKADDHGINITNIFDTNESWETGLPTMAFGRWYPTLTELPDGRMVTMAGRDEAGNVVTTPEIWEGNHWVQLPGAGTLQIPYYPRNFVDPTNGLIFMAGERIQSRWFDPDGSTASGRGKWIAGPSHMYKFNRDYGTAVMYEPGKILYAGGGGYASWPTPDARASVPTATAEKIDLNASSPSWQSAGSMSVARRHLNSTLLPDGQVLITGGTSGGGFVDINTGDAAKTAELWNPATNQWTTLAANSVMRVYHSVSLLLPDATVLHGASGNALAATGAEVPDEKNHEIFSPPYLFKGKRPSISSLSKTTVAYGETFTVTTAYAAQITTVRWIKLGSVTHAFDFGQRANVLEFTRTATGLSVTAPADAKLAPPGHYQLFILNRNGVPSTGKVVRLQ